MKIRNTATSQQCGWSSGSSSSCKLARPHLPRDRCSTIGAFDDGVRHVAHDGFVEH